MLNADDGLNNLFHIAFNRISKQFDSFYLNNNITVKGINADDKYLISVHIMCTPCDRMSYRING